ncbi:autotransporter-associated beta strand repeat-containing protein [Prosthecobacter sp. SYSU 5D2]|uniref:beta strand repeat-containing protein n=1 Tax=Prosthecobacter sp. SYSU 5D2 TaxID=3134134 RepID=UPI0031FEB8D8
MKSPFRSVFYETAFLFLSAVCIFISGTTSLKAQILTWDAKPLQAGLQNGSGAWNTSSNLWMNAESQNVLWSNSPLVTAQFGTTPSVNPSVVTLAQNVQLKGISFLSLGTAAPAAGFQYVLEGAAAGTVIDFGDNGLIQVENFASGGSSNFIEFRNTLVFKGNNLTIQKSSGTDTQFMNIRTVSNPDLTGNLTIGAYIYAAFYSADAFSGLDRLTVLNNGNLVLSAAGNYSVPITATGYTSSYSAIRVTASDVILSGGLTLAGDAGIYMHSSNTGMLINAPITESVPGSGLHRFALTKNNGTLTLAAANTYTGKTTLGRTSSSNAGGITILDFAATGAPQDNILYNGVATPGGLELLGSNIGSTSLVLNGKAGAINSQAMGDVTARQTRSVVTMVSGDGGTMNLSLGNISRVANGMIAFNAPAQGQITSSMADAVLGPWATFKSGGGVQSWAQLSGGVLTGFSGSTPHVTGVSPASDVTSHLAIDGSSTGHVVQTDPLAYLATVSMSDTVLDRAFHVGDGNTLRLGMNGGVQITSNSKSLTIGEAGVTSYLSAGGAAAGASQLILTNNSSTSLLTIHSGIINNAGGGAVNVLVNGTADSITVLTASGTQTGGAILASGALELRNGTALGTAGTVNVLEDGALRFAGGITFSRPVTLSGLGVAGTLSEGRLRNVSGDNTTTGLVTLLSPTNIFSESGTLTIKSASATANAITGTFALGITGPGHVTVDGRIATSSGVMTKTGTGTLTLAGDNTFTSAFTISGGVVHISHANALGTTAGGTTINANSALELSGGITLAAEAVSLVSTGVANTGGIRNISGDNTLTGLVTLNATTTRIHSDTGLLTFQPAGASSIAHVSSSSRTLALGGAGDIAIRGALTRTSTGAYTILKEGNGTLTLAAPVTNTITTLSGGNVHLDFSAPLSPAENILHHGVTAPGTLTINGTRMLITGKSGASNGQTFGATTVTGTGYMTVAQNGAAGVSIAFGALTRSTGGALGITLPAAGSVTTTGGADNALITNTVGIPFMWSLNPVAGDEWLGTAELAGGVRQIVPLSMLPSGGYTPSDANSLSGNADITLGETTTTLSGNTAITTLRFAQPQATLITQSANTLLNLSGILVSSTVGPHVQTISVFQLQAHPAASGNDLPIIQNNTAAPLIISSSIRNQATSGQSTALIKSGPGTLVLTGANGYSGSTRVQEGILHFQSGSISGSTEFILGSGSNSGKIVLGHESTAFNATMDWLQVVGTGMDNRIVGGASVISLLTVDNPTTNNNFRTGFLGGPGVNENNLALSVYDVTTTTPPGLPTVMFLPLGPANTYGGRTQIRNATVEVSVLADQGLASSLGTGNADGVIEMGSGGSSSIPNILAVLRYVGNEVSTTDRPLNIANSVASVVSITTVLENNGTGSLKFTTPFTSTGTNVTASRTFRLSGTHAGDSQIVGIGDNGAAPTVLEKTGPGAWTLAGASTYSGGTTVSEGTLLVSNLTGSATGAGPVTLLPGTTFGGSGRIELAADRSITVGGRLQIGLDYPGVIPTASSLTIITSGAGMLSFTADSVLLLDLISGAGAGDNSASLTSADRAVLQGAVEFGSNVTLRVSNSTGMTTWAVNDQWQLFDWAGLSGPVTGSISNYELPSLPADLMWDTSSLFTSGVLSISLVPEPSRCFLVLVGTLFCLVRRGRSRKENA